MADYKTLMAQRAELDAQIQEAHKREVTGAIAKIREMAAEYDLTAEDVFPSRKGAGQRKGESVAPKYRDKATGATWSGRGKPPVWIRDKDREQFRI